MPVKATVVVFDTVFLASLDPINGHRLALIPGFGDGFTAAPNS
jgi:hypothetical protein